MLVSAEIVIRTSALPHLSKMEIDYRVSARQTVQSDMVWIHVPTDSKSIQKLSQAMMEYGEEKIQLQTNY